MFYFRDVFSRICFSHIRSCCLWRFHDDVIKWKHLPRYWPFVWGIHRSPVNSPHKHQWRRALMFSLICAWINGWESNREAGDWDAIALMSLFCNQHCSRLLIYVIHWSLFYWIDASMNFTRKWSFCIVISVWEIQYLYSTISVLSIFPGEPRINSLWPSDTIGRQ